MTAHLRSPRVRRSRRLGVAAAAAFLAAACSADGAGELESAAPVDVTEVVEDDQRVAEQPLAELHPVLTAEFTLFDTDETRTLADYAGRPLVVNLWASWCPNCINEMPDFEAVHQQLGTEVTFIGVNVDDDRARAEDLREATGVTYLLATDTDTRFQELLGAFAMPATAFVTASGELADVWIGQLTAEKLVEQIEELLLSADAAGSLEDRVAESAGDEMAAADATADDTFDPDLLNLGPGSRQFVPLDEPVLIEASAATWLEPDDIVMGVVSADGSDIQAYPVDQMAYHHIANTRLSGEPFVVTY